MAEGCGTEVPHPAPGPDTLCDLGPVPLPLSSSGSLFLMHPNDRAGFVSAAVGTHPEEARGT